MLAVGIFGAKDELEGLLSYDGILHGGGFYLFGVQLLACCCFAVWASSCTFVLIWVRNISWSDLFSCPLTFTEWSIWLDGMLGCLRFEGSPGC